MLLNWKVGYQIFKIFENWKSYLPKNRNIRKIGLQRNGAIVLDKNELKVETHIVAKLILFQ